jgi:hypothetical protein
VFLSEIIVTPVIKRSLTVYVTYLLGLQYGLKSTLMHIIIIIIIIIIIFITTTTTNIIIHE